MSFNIQNYTELSQVETVQDSALGIMKWGRQNSFPQTLLNLISQSANASSAVRIATRFLKGGEFENSDYIIHPSGITIKDLVDSAASSYAVFEGFSYHVNFNLNYKISNIFPMKMACLRFNEYDELGTYNKIGYHPNFGRNSVDVKNVADFPTKAKINFINTFNISKVADQVAKVDTIKNYQGQIFYHTNTGPFEYPIPPLQPLINFVLSDVENSVLLRKETATGFINSYLLKTCLGAGDKDLIALEDSIAEAQGAQGSGKIITLSGLSEEEVKSTLLEEIGGGKSTTTIDSCVKTYNLNKEVISGVYLIPPALAGIDKNSGFSGQDLEEAYSVYNEITRDGRELIESKINLLLSNSDFEVKSIKLQPLAVLKKSENV